MIAGSGRGGMIGRGVGDAGFPAGVWATEGTTFAVIMVAAIAAARLSALTNWIERRNCIVGSSGCISLVADDEIHVGNFGFMQWQMDIFCQGAFMIIRLGYG